MLPPFQVNVFTEGESNVIVFNEEMHEYRCRCIILRNFADWMMLLKRCFLSCIFFQKLSNWFQLQKNSLRARMKFLKITKCFFKFYFASKDYINVCSSSDLFKKIKPPFFSVFLNSFLKQVFNIVLKSNNSIKLLFGTKKWQPKFVVLH